MAKVKKPQDYGVVVPKEPVLGSRDDEDEFDDEDDEAFEEMSEAGLTLATEDLTVMDFFAAQVAAGIAASGAALPTGVALAAQAYAYASALCQERKRVEAEH